MNLPLKYMKSYKKNTITIFLSFLLTLGLLSSLLILMHSNHRLQAIENQMYVSPADLRITGLSRKQVNKLKVNNSVYRLALSQPVDAYTRGDQTIFYCRGDAYGITMTSKLVEGNLPANGNEIAAEKWVLMNLGIQPVIGQRIDILKASGQKKTVTLVGILLDIPKSKQVGTLSFYSVLRPAGKSNYIASVTFKTGKYMDGQISNLADTIGISAGQIEKSPGRENMQELVKMDLELIAFLLITLLTALICMGISRFLADTYRTENIMEQGGL